MAASLAALQKDVDRIGAGNYLLCKFCTQTSIGLFTPRETLLKLLPNIEKTCYSKVNGAPRGGKSGVSGVRGRGAGAAGRGQC